jgi:hypothetical protein
MYIPPSATTSLITMIMICVFLDVYIARNALVKPLGSDFIVTFQCT